MKKLALAPDELRVESFDTAPREKEGAGTVHAFLSEGSTCHQRVCTCTYGEPYATCDYSCDGTCDGGDTCYPGCEGYVGPTDPGYLGCH